MAYCTNRDLKDVFPSIDEFDTKTPIYGWVVHSSNLYRADNCGLVTQLFANGQDLGDAEANSGVVNSNGEWYYESTLDAVYYYNSASNPNDMLMESGDDWATLKTRYISNAEKYLDSRLDGRLPRKQFKDKDGNYDYILVRTTALLACSFLLRASQPVSEVADALFDEAEKNILSLNFSTIFSFLTFLINLLINLSAFSLGLALTAMLILFAILFTHQCLPL